jgi:DNA processing protein
MNSEYLLWSELGILNKDRFEAIQEVYGDFREAQKHIGPEMLKGLGCRQDTIEKTLERLDHFDEDATIARLKKERIVLVPITDARYPVRLRHIEDSPPFLYAQGDLDILGQPCVALVGTRKMSAYGRRATEEFTPAFSQAGMVTVRGLAHGVDTCVAEETLKAKGKTVAVLGHGFSHLAPASRRKLAQEIVQSGGLILSEFPLDQSGDTYMFPARNRIIAGLSLATVVLEAPEGSGALITAELALDYNREVFVVPGQIFDPNYAGSNMFISKGFARLVTSPVQVLEDLGIVAPAQGSRTDYHPQNAQEEALYPLLTTMPQRMDDLVTKSALTAAQVNATLTMLELSGAAKNVGQGQWVRS